MTEWTLLVHSPWQYLRVLLPVVPRGRKYYKMCNELSNDTKEVNLNSFKNIPYFLMYYI